MQLSNLNEHRLSEFLRTVRMNPYITQEPTIKQAAYLIPTDLLEGFYGGAAGPGKSSGLLMAALQYVTEPEYSALLLRRTYKDLALPGALMDRAHDWLHDKAKWDEQEKTWRFPRGATLTFGYLENEKDKYRYQGAEFQFVGFDELTQFSQTQYEYLFSRLRRLKDSNIPIRMRSASNPGGEGHDWVKERFILPSQKELLKLNRFSIRATMDDNPHLDKAAYEKSMENLDPITREQLRNGDWDVSLSGGMFKREWLSIVPGAPDPVRKVRFWDMAATPEEEGQDPDWTVGALLGENEGKYYVMDVVRVREDPGTIEKIIQQTAAIDGIRVEIWMEQEPGSSGKIVIDNYARKVLKGYNFKGEKSTGPKIERAKPLSAAAFNGNLKICAGTWNSAFVSELVAFPLGPHDDQTDAASGGFSKLSKAPGFKLLSGI